MENEGMRNIASHIARELEALCELRSSALGDPAECLRNSVGADAVLIFARASTKTAYLAKVLRIICPRVYFILVQKPESGFLKSVRRSADRFSYFSILPRDGAEISDLGGNVRPLAVGIDRGKFHPASDGNEKAALRQKYGFSGELPLVVHVGHLSAGRGLEEFLSLPSDKFDRLVVASGMFHVPEVEKTLLADGVRIIKEYIPDISEIYRMADVYLFPTRSAEFVISIPLSVTEALACGIPVVAFNGVEGIGAINSTNAESLMRVENGTELVKAVQNAAEAFCGRYEDLLSDMCGWDDAAKALIADITEDIGIK